MATTMRTARTINVADLAVNPVSTARSTRHEVDVESLLVRPADRDDLVAAMRFAIAWRVEGGQGLDDLAAAAGVEVARLIAFLRAPAARAGELLTLAEAGRLARVLEERLVDRDLEDEYDDAVAIAEPYIEIAMVDGVEGSYRRALRTARAARQRHRAANPDAVRLGLS